MYTAAEINLFLLVQSGLPVLLALNKTCLGTPLLRPQHRGVNLLALYYLECGATPHDWRYMYLPICFLIG